MANKLIRLNLGDGHADLPSDDLAKELAAAGYDRPPRQIRLNEVDYLPLNDRGKELLMNCSPYESLMTANLACHLLAMPDIDASMRDVVKSTYRLIPPMPTETISFICPLEVSVEDDSGLDLVEGDHSLLDDHEDEIRNALHDELPGGENMADFLKGGLEQKVASMEWGVTRVRGTLYGSISCELRAPLTDDEQAELIGWIRGQNADGYGEIFEQHPVDTSDGALYVHFWHSGDDYFVMPSEDFFQQLHEQEQGFGGMGGLGIHADDASGVTEHQKPDCPLLGQDGNVFNLIGLAARTLRQSGLHDQAEEMSERAMGSGSYDQALGIITEYVNVTSVEADMDEDEDWSREAKIDDDDWPEEEQGFDGGMGGMA